MTRDITEAAQTAAALGHVRVAIFVEIQFASGTERLCNAAYDQEWDEKTWSGIGHLGSIGPVEEGADAQARGVKLILSGIPADRIASALGEYYQSRTGRIWLAPLDANYQFIVDPVLIHKGKLDAGPIHMGKECSVEASLEPPNADWDRARTSRFNNADQQDLYPGDIFFEFAEFMAGKQIVVGWS